MGNIKHHASVEVAKVRLSHFNDMESFFRPNEEAVIMREMEEICVSEHYKPTGNSEYFFETSPLYYYDLWAHDKNKYPGVIFPLIIPVEKWYTQFSLAMAIHKKSNEYMITSLICYENDNTAQIDFQVSMFFKNISDFKAVFREVTDKTVEYLLEKNAIAMSDINSSN